MRLWRELLDAHPWVTADVFRTGVNRIAWEHAGEFLPTPKAALGFFEAAAEQLRREAQKALPPPREPPATGDEAMERFRAMVREATAKGHEMHVRHKEIVGEAQRMGLKQGTDAMSAYVRTEYARALRGGL